MFVVFIKEVIFKYFFHPRDFAVYFFYLLLPEMGLIEIDAFLKPVWPIN